MSDADIMKAFELQIKNSWDLLGVLDVNLFGLPACCKINGSMALCLFLVIVISAQNRAIRGLHSARHLERCSL